MSRVDSHPEREDNPTLCPRCGAESFREPNQICASCEDLPDEPHALPDVEIFYQSAEDFLTAEKDTWQYELMAENTDDPTHDREVAEQFAGWYYCLPGCLPDSGPVGPFRTEKEAYEACIEENE